MRAAAVGALVHEAQSVVQAIRDELAPGTVGPIVVTGMLAEQLAKELAAGAAPGAVVADDRTRMSGAEVLVRIVAGDPSETDEAFVRTADSRGIPVVIVQLWPQADWTRPFVLSPFVVECRAGEGFPVREIADRIVDASERGSLLAARIPALNDSVSHGFVRQAVIRAAVISFASRAKGATRPLIALEQVRMLARLRASTPGATESDEVPVIASGTALALAAGFAFRGLARSAREVLPAPVVDGAVAAAGTWALAKALRVIEARLPTP